MFINLFFSDDRFIYQSKGFILFLQKNLFCLVYIAIVVTSDFVILMAKYDVYFDYNFFSIENSLSIHRRPSISIIISIMIFIYIIKPFWILSFECDFHSNWNFSYYDTSNASNSKYYHLLDESSQFITWKWIRHFNRDILTQ